MTIQRFFATACLAVFPALSPAYGCELIGQVSTDGTGSPDTYRSGGKYKAVAKELITPGSVLFIQLTGGDLRYVTLHDRTSGGGWDTSYQGAQVSFGHNDAAIAGCMAEPNCTHIIVALNGAHERYETMVSSADVLLCLADHAGQAAPADPPPAQSTPTALVLDQRMHAPQSGWSIGYPSSWTSQLDDDPNGGSGVFSSPDGNTVVGVSTFTTGMGADANMLIPQIEGAMFEGGPVLGSQPVELGGIAGEMRRYDMQPGNPMSAVAAYLDTGQRLYVVWAITPTALSQANMQQAATLIDSFETVAHAPPSVRDQENRMIGMALSSNEAVQYGNVGHQTHISRQDGAIYYRIEIAASVAASDWRKYNTVVLRATHVDTSRVASASHATVDASLGDRPVVLAGKMPINLNMSADGAYLVTVEMGPVRYGSRMIILGDAQ